MVDIFTGTVIIKNTRTGGQDPNTLGANFSPQGVLTPVLAVNGKGLSFSTWNIVPTIPDFPNVSPSYIQMTVPDGTIYNLGVSFPPSSKAVCVMNEIGRTPPGTVFDQWYFPYDTRILLAYNLIDPDREELSLDTGLYPQVAIWDFHSSVNQTWQITQAP